MKNSDDAHVLTDTIYKNLSDNFNAGIRQIVITGKAYQKTLVGVASAARSFHEALANVGSSARLCKGGTEQIGEAIQQIAEAQRDIQAKLDESTKLLISDVILPLEHKLDHDFRNATSEQRKYHHGHKTIWGPYSKAHESLKKFRKKSRNKIAYNEQREAECVRTLNKCQERLEQYRMQGLKLALVEERKCHCFLLEKLCAFTSLQMVCHRQACDALSPLPAWRQLCANPLVLPPSGEHMVTLSQEGPMNGSAGFPQENGYMYTTRSAHGPIHRSRSAAHLDSIRDGDFEMSKTLPVRSMVLPPPPSGTLKMRALYSHTGETEEQLGFTEGDIIVLVGEKSDGWQYGQNLRSGRYGWFPLSFTEPFYNSVPPDLIQSSPKMNHRVRSMGDLLDSRSLSDQNYGGHDIPGNARRPNSMFEETSLNVVSSVSQQPYPPSPDTMGPPGGNSTQYGNPARQPSYPPPPPPAPPGSQNHPPVDYGGVEEDVIFQSNPMFANVSLRKAVTNDRSAPKIK